mmetsp:Transcript_63505/g.168265  ORF Transcript_63505/g.168265 Transcript_63505/m.168265 type:complete len:211 (+) Transcript_63505:409-1041(+)
MRCCAAAASWLERVSVTLRSCQWRCLCVFRICSIMRLTPQGSCKLTEGISLSWVFLRTLCRISLWRPPVQCLGPSVRPCGVAATWLVFTGLNIGHCCRRVCASHPSLRRHSRPMTGRRRRRRVAVPRAHRPWTCRQDHPGRPLFFLIPLVQGPRSVPRVQPCLRGYAFRCLRDLLVTWTSPLLVHSLQQRVHRLRGRCRQWQCARMFQLQ